MDRQSGAWTPAQGIACQRAFDGYSAPLRELRGMERWPSGLRRSLGKRVYGKPYRGFESLPLRQSAALKRIPAPLEAGIRSVHYPHSASCISLAELPEGRFTSPTAAYRRDDEDRLLFLIPMFRSATCGAVLFVGMSFSKFTNVAS